MNKRKFSIPLHFSGCQFWAAYQVGEPRNHTCWLLNYSMECLRIGISIERKRIRHEMNTKSRQYGADWERYVGNSPILWYGSASCHSEWEYPQVVEPWNSQMMTLTFLFLSKRLRICTVVSERKNQASDRSWLQGLNHRGLIRQMSRQSVCTLLTVEFHT